MKKEDDIFKIMSDFMKGKSGPPGASMAKLTIEGDVELGDLELPPKSSTFRDFLKEYPIVRNGMANYSLEHCLLFLGAMLTLPEFQSNAYRLEMLVHMAFLCAKGKARPTAGNAAAWFNQLDEGTCGRQEDPSEDVFVSSVSFQSEDFRIFEGSAEGNGFYTQLFLTILEEMPVQSPYTLLKLSVKNLLKLSDAIADRSGLHPYVVGATSPTAKIRKPDDRIWSDLGKRVSFTFDDLATISIDPRTLQPFIVASKDTENLATQGPGHSSVDTKPIFPTKRGVIVHLPGLVGTAIRDLIIQSCIHADMEDHLHVGLGNAYTNLFSRQVLLGTSTITPSIQPYGQLLAAVAMKQIDAGRYLHLIFIVDSFKGFEEGAFMSMNDVSTWSDLVAKSIDQAHAQLSVHDDFREGLTLVVGCGWGRSLGLVVSDLPKKWRMEMMPANDIVTLSNVPSFETLDILRILDALEDLDDMGISIDNASGFLNLYAWMKGNNGHIVPHEKLDDDFGGEPGSGNLAIPTNSNLAVRHQAYIASDVRTLPRPDGSTARVRRAHGTPRYGTSQLAPFYVDLESLANQVFRSVYVGENGVYWIEANTRPELDQKISFELCKMLMHWGEAVFKYIDENGAMKSVSLISCIVHLDDQSLPSTSEPITAAEEIPSFIETLVRDESTGRVVQIEIKEGFLNSTRRPDNRGERAIVSALVTALLRGVSDGFNSEAVEAAVSAIVRSEKARHFHAFSVPQLRDFVRTDLPESAQVIEQMDDTNARLGLGWLCRDRTEGANIEGLANCKDYLRKLVDALIQSFLARLAMFNRTSLVEAMLRNHEAALSELDTWKRTYGAIEALSDEASLASSSAIERMGRLNAASMSSRIAIEAAVCSCPIDRGLVPGRYDIAQLMAFAATIHYMGGYSEAMAAGIMPPKIRISPAGDVMMRHEFSDEVVRPFGDFFQTKTLKDAALSYIEHYHSPDNSSESADQTEASADQEEQFREIWLDEYGFSLDALADFVRGFNIILEADRKAVMHFTHSELVERLQAETEMTTDSITACMNLFTYQPRDPWNASPGGFMSSAWFPWRFQRQLSVVSRPIVQISNKSEGEYLISPAMVIASISKFVSDAMTAGFDQKFFREDGLMSRWTGSISGEQGEAFNVQVAEAFSEIGWEAKPNLSDGGILKRRKDPSFGDVDVLASNMEQGRVLIIECKDLSFDKTIGEIAWRLSKYQGDVKPNGKRDDLRSRLITSK